MNRIMPGNDPRQSLKREDPRLLICVGGTEMIPREMISHGWHFLRFFSLCEQKELSKDGCGGIVAGGDKIQLRGSWDPSPGFLFHPTDCVKALFLLEGIGCLEKLPAPALVIMIVIVGL